MVAGLGTGLFLFDVNGAPVNPLDNFAGRKGAGGIAPASRCQAPPGVPRRESQAVPSAARRAERPG
jgi:hypothetical protein